MMKARENRATRKIFYKCTSTSCRAEDTRVHSNLVSRKEMRQDRGQRLHIYRSELANDKTLSRRKGVPCRNPNARCDNNEVVMFLGGGYHARDTKVDLVFMCTACNFKWLHEPKTNDEGDDKNE